MTQRQPYSPPAEPVVVSAVDTAALGLTPLPYTDIDGYASIAG